MISVGKALRECRRDAKLKKLTQQKVAEAVSLVPSYISKLETGEIIPNFSENDIEKLIQLFRKYQVSETRIQEFTDAYTSSLVTGGAVSDQDSAIAQKIYSTLRNLDDKKKLAYRKELTDRNNVWHGINQTLNDFQSGPISFREIMKVLDGLEETEDGSTSYIKSRLRLESSRINRYLGEVGAAKTKLSQSLELAKKTKNDALLAEILKERGDFYRRSDQGNLRAAMLDYEEARTIYENVKDNDGKANSQIRIASVYLTAGQPNDALQLCEDSLKYARMSRDIYLERKSLEYKAWALSMLGNFDKAIHLQLDAHEIASKSNNQPKELAKSATYLAGFYLICGLIEEAEKYYFAADNYVEQMLNTNSNNPNEEKEIFIRVLIYLGLGTVKTQRPSERIEARSYLMKSLEFAEQSNDFLTLGRAFKQLGELDLVEGVQQGAQEKFESADLSFKRTGLDHIGNPYYLSNLGFDFIELDFRSNNNSRIAERLKEIQVIASKMGYREYSIRCRLWNAKLLFVGDLHSNIDKIVDLYFSALKDAISTDPHLLRIAHNQDR